MYNYLDESGPRFAGNYAVVRPDSSGVFTVVSYNIKMAEEIDLALAELSRDPETAHADVLLLQEMDEEGSARIARTLALNYVYYPASVHTASGRNFGNAVLSRWPIVSDSKILLPHGNMTRGQRRIAVRAIIDIGNHCIQVFSVHAENLSLDRRLRLEQADSLVNQVYEEPFQSIVGGDFNTVEAPALEETVELFEKMGFEWSSEQVGATARFALIDVQSDHIFARGMSAIRSGQISTAQASDHKPVWVQFSIDARDKQPRGC